MENIMMGSMPMNPTPSNKKLPRKTEGRATISHLSHDGRGIAHVDGKITFIFGALPGEEVLFSYSARRSKFDEAFVTKVLVPSSERVQPRCRFFGQCGGCSLQHISQISQITHKQAVLLEQLLHFGLVVPENVLTPLKADPYGYRRKARYSVRHVVKKQRVFVGFRELHNPRFLAEIDTCEVLHPSLAKLLAPLQDCLSNLENKKHIAQIEAAVGDNATALIIRHLEPLFDIDREQLLRFAEDQDVWLFLQPKGYDSIHRVYPLDGETSLKYPITDNITLNFNPADFTQINDSINRQMIQQALSLLELSKEDVVLDLFCGIGNFSLPIAEKAAQVFGVEGDEKLVTRAKINARENNITNANFFCADLNKIETLPTILPRSFNKMLIDPPRSGAQAVVESMDLERVETIIYVSCNPATLARDAGILKKRGFVLTHAGVMDMFTHTEHVEAMAAFKRVVV